MIITISVAMAAVISPRPAFDWIGFFGLVVSCFVVVSISSLTVISRTIIDVFLYLDGIYLV